MSIHGVGNNQSVQRVVSNPIQRTTPTSATPTTAATDRLELSGMTHLLQTLKSNDVRVDKVAAVKAQIEAGTYETEAKLDVTADRMLDDLA